MQRKKVTIDGNEAAAYVAHQVNEVIAIYPITPSSPMGELSDAWSSENRKNIWGTIPVVAELQSEGGAASRSAAFGPQRTAHLAGCERAGVQAEAVAVHFCGKPMGEDPGQVFGGQPHARVLDCQADAVLP